MLFAGHETTASLLSWVIFELGNHPEWRSRLREEQLAVVGNNPLNLSHLKQLPDLTNVLKNSQMTIDVRLTDGGGRKKTIQIQGKNRQVWIITQENTRELYDVDGIRIKEISVQDLIQIFNKRLYSDAFEEDELSAHLAVIDKT